MIAAARMIARDKKRNNQNGTGKKALSIDDAVKLVKEAEFGDQQFEDVKVFLGSRVVYDSFNKIAIQINSGRTGWPGYEPTDFRVYEKMSKEEAIMMSKLSLARYNFSHHPWSKNQKMLMDYYGRIESRNHKGVQALEKMYELYGENRK